MEIVPPSIGISSPFNLFMYERMTRKTRTAAVTAIVPTYNEAARIGRVLDVLTAYPGFAEVIVVDDGSWDGTERVAQRYPVRFLQNKKNRGKGFAMNRGVELAKTPIVFFADADVVGLTHEMIDQLVLPVVHEEVDMCIAMRGRWIYHLPGVLACIPHLGGERAVQKTLWNALPDYYKHRFRVETGLNYYAKHGGKGFYSIVFDDLTQVIKEKKYGFLRGTWLRWQMSYNVFTAHLRLKFIDHPAFLQGVSRRKKR